ncbi:ribonuclease H2, subunit B [Gongronella butleri]|nr:ribonuclease H2, subunit B [Gongronella butleri]
MGKSIVAFIKDDVSSLKSLSLPCPRTGQLTTYLFDQEKNALYEASKVDHKTRSCWLIDSQVYIDGNLYFMTRMDPLFICLGILDRSMAEDMFKPMDDLFLLDPVAGANDIMCLISATSKQLAHLCDTQEITPGGPLAYRYNPMMARQWLQKKVHAVAAHLRSIEPLQAAEDRTDKEKEDHFLRQAIFTIARYITNDWAQRLFSAFDGLDEEEPAFSEASVQPAASVGDYMQMSRRKEMDEDPSPPKKTKPAVPRSLAKVNTRGMKPLTSFFKKA